MLAQHIENIVAALAAAIRHDNQETSPALMINLRSSYEAAQKALIVVEGRDHHHVSGETIGKPIDACAVCGKDLRDPIHFRS